MSAGSSCPPLKLTMAPADSMMPSSGVYAGASTGVSHAVEVPADGGTVGFDFRLRILGWRSGGRGVLDLQTRGR